MVKNVIKQCDEEAKTGQLKHLITQSNACVANYCAVSVCMMSKLQKRVLKLVRMYLVLQEERDHALRNTNSIVMILIQE